MSSTPLHEDDVAELLHLLDKHRLLEQVARRQETPRSALLEQLQHRQNLVELHKRLRTTHPADIAHLMEIASEADRLIVWNELSDAVAAEALVEASPGLKPPLIESTPRDRLLRLLGTLDADDLRYLSEFIDPAAVESVLTALNPSDREWVQGAPGETASSVAALMTREVLKANETETLAEVVARLRARGALPPNHDRLFVVDSRNVLSGALSLGALITGDPAQPVSAMMDRTVRAFAPGDEAEVAVQAFERYDLFSAPVVDDRRKLIGRVTADVVVDFIRASGERDVLGLAGLRSAENLFAPVLDSARNRWPWLAVNLATAFAASRIIGAFEPAIEQLVALAALMPIVASIGGNTGNQTVALVIRGLALDQIGHGNRWHLFRKELTVSVLNGAVWGAAVGIFATAVYRSAPLGLVMTAAVFLNLVVAACVGVAVPLTLTYFERDPAQGASVILTFVTDGMGFLLFLGLATLFLL